MGAYASALTVGESQITELQRPTGAASAGFTG